MMLWPIVRVKVGWNMEEISVWENHVFLDGCESPRRIARKRHPHLTFDCFKAKVKGQKVVCSTGSRISHYPGGAMTLVSVLRGRTASVCDLCLEFDGGD